MVPFNRTAVRDGGSGRGPRQGQLTATAPSRTGAENVDQVFGLSKRQVMART